MDIVIRKARKGDAKGVAESFNEGLRRGLNKYTGSNTMRGPKKIRQYEKTYVERKRSEFGFVAVDKRSANIVGSANFSAKDSGRMRHRGEMGWGVHPDYRGRGIATRLVKAVISEAKRRGFKKVQCEVSVRNIASIRIAKKCGMKIEGRRKAGILLDNGTYSDTYIFGRVLR